MTKAQLCFLCVVALTGVSAVAQSRPALRCPPGATCRSNGAAGTGGPNTSSYGVADASRPGTSDPEEQKIWRAAQQLNLDSDQRAQLDSSLKAQKNGSATLDKELQEARAAFTHALQNGQIPLDNEIENLASASAKVEESQLKCWAALYAVLTPDQQKQMLMMPTPLSQATTESAIVQAQ